MASSTDYFDLAAYLTQTDAIFPSAYLAAVAFLVLGLLIGIVGAILLRRYQNHKGSALIPLFTLPVLGFLLGGGTFFVFDNTVREHNLYSYAEYSADVNEELQTWADARYGIHLTIDQATNLKYTEQGAILNRDAVSYSKVELPSGERVEVVPHFEGQHLTLRYIDDSGNERKLPVVQ